MSANYIVQANFTRGAYSVDKHIEISTYDAQSKQYDINFGPFTIRLNEEALVELKELLSAHVEFIQREDVDL